MSGANAQPGPILSPSTTTMRAEATWFLDQQALPRYEVVRRFDVDFRHHLEQLLPLIEQMTAGLTQSDMSRNVALAGAREARRRLTEVEAAGLDGEVNRVGRLARSVVSLCDHYDSLIAAASGQDRIPDHA
ncbi:DUF6415 family natural product biosynthesis protein [Streptomyces nodosus]|uniref:DUF6415 family natural product biosynthesis protein n=1 Tax=Streptomyces nodosus TaxID=40318 RepID=UPI00381C1C6A